MAKKRSEERRIQEAVEMGQKNARLIPQIRNWCSHLSIKLKSAGLVAEIYQLPVGLMSISCPHASAGGIMSMHLNHVATEFITSNCRDCPHHQLVALDNIGREILDREDKLRACQLAEKNQANQAKLQLRELVSGDLTEALRREDITAQSVFELVALLDDEATQVEAAKKLVKAAELAPDFFTSLAIEVICSYFPEPQHGELCMDVILGLGAKSHLLPEVAFLAAKACLEKANNQDKACLVIGRCWQSGNFIPDADLVERIVGTQNHHYRLQMHQPTNFDGSNFALVVAGEKDLALLIATLRRRLGINDKYKRVNTARVIQILSDNFPELAQELVDPLIDSLELDDDIYEDSADGEACRTLAAIYVRHPEFTQEKIEEGYRRLSAEGKEVIIGVFRAIIWGAKDPHEHNSEMAPVFQACIPRIIQYLLQIISGLAHPVDAKVAATDVIESVAEYHLEYLDEHLDSLLGAVANLIHEKVLFNEKEPSGMLGEMNKQGRLAIYSRAAGDIVNAIKKICVRAPRIVLERLKEIVPNLDSGQLHLAAYKAELTEIYGELGRNPDFLPDVIPELYKLLVDFSSPIVRGTAVQAVAKILEKNQDALPQNMVDLLIVYLTDTYVYVHKSAVRVFQYLKPGNRDEAIAIVQSLLALNKHYEDSPYFREEILRAMIHITWEDSLLLQRATIPVLVEHCQSSEYYSWSQDT